MKSTLLAALLIALHGNAHAATDTSKIIVPELSYHSLDSIIRTNEYTGIYFWPTWCASCFEDIPGVVAVLKEKKSISLLLINEARSRSKVPKRLVNYPETVKGYWRMKAIYFRQIISINNLLEMKFFNEHFMHKKIRSKDEFTNPAFFLLDRKGKLLWVTKRDFSLDSLKAAVVNYQ